MPFRLLETSIEQDPVLSERYRYDVPVVFIDGQRAFKHHLDPRQLEDRIRRATSALTAVGTHP